MRGDSRRDLYAKTLALCGLGVLAGIGAVVDYWPVAIRFPAADAVVGDRRPAPLDVPDDAWARVENVTVSEAPAVIAVAATMDREGRPIVPAPLVVSDAASIDVGAPIRILEAPAPAVVRFVEAGPPAPVPTDMVARLEAPTLPDDAEPVERLAADGRSSDHGVFGTAVRVTGRSLARSGAATGASLADAFRAVGGFFRRALPD